MGKISRKWRRKSLYKKSLILFTIFLVFLGIVFLGYVYNSMILYERNLVDNYIKYILESGKLKEEIDNSDIKISEYEKKNAKISDGIKELYKNNDLVVKKNSKLSSDNLYTYDLMIEDNVISTISLKSVREYKRMAILTIDEWEVTKIETNFEKGLYNYEISIPDNYKLYINNKLASDDDIKSSGDVEGLDRLTKYVEINKSKTYKIDNLIFKPEIVIKDNDDKNVKYEEKYGKITVSRDFINIESLEDAKKHIKDNFNVLELAENYSLFLTNDLGGTLHGFYKLSPYLIKDSYMYEMAHGWATQVDILFVSNHRLKNPVFTNEEVKNFTIYNDNAFSCEVYLEKNMIVNSNDKVDKMHDRLYFVYYDGGYKLVDMKSI